MGSTFRVLEEIGVETGGLYSKGLRELDLNQFHCLVNLTEHPMDLRLPFDLEARVIDRSVPDPYGRPVSAYRETRDIIQRLILQELSEWVS
jgi:protein-tyrosine-phosphatase